MRTDDRAPLLRARARSGLARWRVAAFCGLTELRLRTAESSLRGALELRVSELVALAAFYRVAPLELAPFLGAVPPEPGARPKRPRRRKGLASNGTGAPRAAGSGSAST